MNQSKPHPKAVKCEKCRTRWARVPVGHYSLPGGTRFLCYECAAVNPNVIRPDGE